MASEKKYYSFSIPVREFWRIYLPATALALFAAGAAGFFFVDLVIMPGVVGINRDMVDVPDISGLSLEQGRENLFAAGLLTEIRERQYDDTVPVDAIIGQTPLPGEKVKKGRRILVTVSKGKEIAVIPYVKNMTEHQARNMLNKQGFMSGVLKKTFNDTIPLDRVIDAFPGCGTTISRDMKVSLILSKGPKPSSAEMPNVVGEPIADAKKKVEDAGLTVGKINYRNDPSLLPGTVVSQSISPGSAVPFETAADLTVSVIQ